MNTKDRLSLFEKYAIQNGDAQKVVDYKTINETHDKLCRYIKEMMQDVKENFSLAKQNMP